MLSDTEARIAHLELRIEKLKRELYGQRSERTARLIEQLELQLEDLLTSATEDELVAQAAKAQTVRSLRVCTNYYPGNGSACAKPTSPPISRPPDLHATPSQSPPRPRACANQAAFVVCIRR